MIAIRLAAGLLAVTALAAPAFAEDPPAAAAPPAATAPAPATGRVYVSYPVQDRAKFDSQLAFDDLWLREAIKPGTCVYFDLPAGNHTMHTTAKMNYRLELAAGASQYVDIKFRGGLINNVIPVEGSAPADLAACTQGSSPL